MNPVEADSEMLDAPQNSSRSFVPSVEIEDGRAIDSAFSQDVPNSTSSHGQQENSSIANSDLLRSSRKRHRESSREPSILANNVASNLSIKMPGGQSERMIEGEFLDEEDAERKPPAPYASSLPTGLCYDVRMRYHCELDPPTFRSDYHPEDPRRIFKIYKELCIAGLVKNDLLNVGPLIPNPLLNISARNVTEAEVCLVHDQKHFEFMRSTASIVPKATTSSAQ